MKYLSGISLAWENVILSVLVGYRKLFTKISEDHVWFRSFIQTRCLKVVKNVNYDTPPHGHKVCQRFHSFINISSGLKFYSPQGNCGWQSANFKLFANEENSLLLLSLLSEGWITGS